jgi:signal transduction histidine kinase
LRQSQKLEAVGRLAGGVAHELNTPIQFVSDNVRFVSEMLVPIVDVARQLQPHHTLTADTSPSNVNDDVDVDFALEEVPKALSDALAGLERIATVIRSLKTFGQADRNEPTATDINEMISSTLVLIENELRIVADITTELTPLPTVVAYAGELNQVWLNLLTNAAHAIAAADRGRGNIIVRTSHTSDAVVVEVQDDGVGIPIHASERIFDPFYTTKEVGQGMGQGLAVARRTVVERHHGSITFESKHDIGTVFRVELPLT